MNKNYKDGEMTVSTNIGIRHGEPKVSIEFTVGEIKEMLLPLYEFSIFDMIRNDEEIDNPKWLQGQMRIYGRLLNAVEGREDGEV